MNRTGINSDLTKNYRDRYIIASLVLVCGLIFVQKGRAQVELGPEHSFEAGHSVDICVNSTTGHPHVIWESLGKTIQYSYYTDSDWTTPITVPGPTDVGCYAGEPPVRSADEIAVSMEIDSSGYVHIAYIAGTVGTTLYHIHQTAGGWSPGHRFPGQSVSGVREELQDLCLRVRQFVFDMGFRSATDKHRNLSRADRGDGFPGLCPCSLQQEVWWW